MQWNTYPIYYVIYKSTKLAVRCGASYGATLGSTLIRHANLQWPLMALNHVHITDHFFHIQRGSKLFLKCFCNDLHQFHSQSSKYGVSSVQLRRLSFQKAILILDVVPVIPGSHDPQPNASHTYIEIYRSKGYYDDSVSPVSGIEAICGSAFDTVTVLRQEDEAGVTEDSGPGDNPKQIRNTYRDSEHLVTLGWSYRLPRLLDILSLVTLLSVAYPYYNIFTRRCSWLAHAACVILEHRCGGLRVVDRRCESRLTRVAHFLFNDFHPTVNPALIEFWQREDKWRQLAAGRRGISD